MPKAIKVHTPGSGVFPVKKKKGRPKNIENAGKVVKKGTRRKGNYRSKYTQEDFKLAVESIQDGMSVRKAAEEFNVPRTTLMDRLHNRTTDKLGRPCELTEEEENLLADRVKLMGDWGFPLTMIDVRKLVQDYLNSSGKRSRWFDNYPGEDWAYGFVKRRKDLSNRMSNLIKRSRAALSREQVKEFVENYTRVAADIPPSNVFNYDETNLTEDPGAKKALYRPGVKYAEKVSNHSKSCSFGQLMGRCCPHTWSIRQRIFMNLGVRGVPRAQGTMPHPVVGLTWLCSKIGLKNYFCLK